MTRAYAEEYLNDAMESLGEAFDYAVNVCSLGIDEFMDLFIASGYSDSFSKGCPKYVSGLSGTELVMEIVGKAGKQMSSPSRRRSTTVPRDTGAAGSLRTTNGRRDDPLRIFTTTFLCSKSGNCIAHCTKHRKISLLTL